MTSPLDGINTLAELAKVAISADDKIKLVEASAAMMALLQDNERLLAENKDLQESLNRRKDLERKDDGYYVIEGDTEYGPVCPECYLSKGLIYTLCDNGLSYTKCLTCGKHYTTQKDS